MHPVMSELGVYLAEHESWTRQEAARQDRLVREAIAHGGGRSMVARFVLAVRQFVDPRGYALAEMQTRVAVRMLVEAPPVATVAPVTLLDVWEPDSAARAEQVAA